MRKGCTSSMKNMASKLLDENRRLWYVMPVGDGIHRILLPNYRLSVAFPRSDDDSSSLILTFLSLERATDGPTAAERGDRGD